MLVGLLKFVFDVVIFLLSVCMGLLIVYVLMTLIIPQNKYTQLLGKYVEPFLAPVRALIGKLFPRLASGAFDFSPVGLWLLLLVAQWLIKLLKGILL